MSLHLKDNEARLRFVNEIDRNFSVLAPAGVGKTHSIVQRILALARANQPSQESALRNLAVVTYTRKAAAEMRERTLNAWAKQSGAGPSGRDLDHVFFGTIHSFCLELIKLHGHVLGLNGRLQLVDAQDPLLWEDFLASPVGMRIQSTYPQHPWFSKLLQFSDVLNVAQKLPAHYNKSPRADAAPRALDCSAIENYEPPKPQLNRGVLKVQTALREWQSAMDREGFAPVGFVPFKTGGESFMELCHEVFKPLKDWAGAQAMRMAQSMRVSFKEYCAQQGWISYEDMVHMANSVLDHPAIAQHFAEHPMRVILDEAQDTDQAQFRLLLRACAIDPDLTARSSRGLSSGRFSMVGDPQQAIYSSRTHVGVYERLHRELVECGALEELKFQVTYRCGEHIVSALNQIFPSILSTTKPAQVDFNTLAALPDPHPGQMVRIALMPQSPFDSKIPEPARAHYLADALADWLAAQSLGDLRASGWEDVAILCPRNGWLDPLARALEKRGLSCQVRSKQSVPLDNPAHAWALALLAVMADPWDGFELIGVLREVFGLPDDTMAHYVEAHGTQEQAALQIAQPPAESDSPLGQVLAQLHQLWREVSAMPLASAVRAIFSQAQLIERLNLLPIVNLDKARYTLESLCGRAAIAEVAGLSLVNFVKELVDRCEVSIDEASLEVGKIQLLTCHSAKGLQWATVIVPYFFRPIAYAPPRYPELLYSERLDEAQLKTDADHIWPALERALEDEASAELGRLMYVTMTRAKHSLILVDDRAFWSGATGSSLAQCAQMTLGGSNHERFVSMPASLTPEAVYRDQIPVLHRPHAQPPMACASALQIKNAQRSSKNFLAQVLPSSLAVHSQPYEMQPSLAVAAHGPDYGNAWHALMEALPWRGTPLEWDLHFEAHKLGFPSPERASAEWALFKGADFLKFLEDPMWLIRVEVPFLAPIAGQQSAYQGV
ncbi:MAG: hypothetical protein B7X06_01270, partial [Verrucomicrobia bacterium 21-51-4]